MADSNKYEDAIMNKSYRRCCNDFDYDVDEVWGGISHVIDRLFDACDVSIDKTYEPHGKNHYLDSYTDRLVSSAIKFVAFGGNCELGSSGCDYCADDVLWGFVGYKLRLRDNEAAASLLHDLCGGVRANAFYPDYELNSLVEVGIHVDRYDEALSL